MASTGGEHPADKTVQVIESRSGWRAVDLTELWRYRGLLAIFVWRDLRVRYRQTVLGLIWVLLQPLAMTVVYSIFFGYIARIPSDGVPYPVFFLGGMILWQSFALAVGEGSTSLVAQQRLITKIYFPRVLAPLTSVISAYIDFCVTFFLLIAVMLFYGMTPSWRMVIAPGFVLLSAALAFAVSLWLSALDALYRDIRFILGFCLQIWYFATPVLYPLSIVPEKWRVILQFNPMAAAVQGFRWSIFGNVAPPNFSTIGAGIVVTLLLLASGAMFFHRVEKSVIDRI